MVDEQQTGVNDAEIEEIVAQDEPGVGEVIAAYEEIERVYFGAVTPIPSGTYVTNTTAVVAQL